MRSHPIDLTSLAWGIVLTMLTGLLAVAHWTDTNVDTQLVVPAVLVCLGVLLGVTALVRRPVTTSTPEPDVNDES